MEEYKRITEIQKNLNLPRSSIYYLIRKFKVRSKKIGLRKRLYDFNQLKEIIKKYYSNGK
jgi:hypothetical protein